MQYKSQMKNIVLAAASILFCVTVGGISGFLTSDAITSWYVGIQKPLWNPPNWIFGPIWTLLYILMGCSLFLILKTAASNKRLALALFLTQLALNFFWSPIFFNLHELGWALLTIVALWGLIIITIFAFATIHKTAAWLLVPYVCWVSFAALLNLSIWQLNH